MQIRPYQESAIKAVQYGLISQSAILCQLPTGAGKTFVFCSIIQMIIAKKKTVIVLVNRDVLIDQASKSLTKFGVIHSIIKQKSKWCNGVVVASMQTIGKWNDLPEADFCIVDECHLSIFDKAVTAYKAANTRVIGFTATPWRAAPKQPISHFYQQLHQGPPITELIQDGFLCHCEIYSPKIALDKLQISKGEYTEESQQQTFNNRASLDSLLREYLKYRQKKTIVFCSSKASALEVCNFLVDNGIKALYIDGDATKTERDAVDWAIRHGDGEVVCNCALLTFGYDNEILDTNIIFRATTSLALWIQMAGRVSRIYPGKEKSVILDFGANAIRHGHWMQYIDWQPHFVAIGKKGNKKAAEDVIPTHQECPNCYKFVAMSLSHCDGCGHELKAKGQDKKKDVELVKVDFFKKTKIHDNILEIEIIRITKGYSPSWTEVQLLKLNYDKNSILMYLHGFRQSNLFASVNSKYVSAFNANKFYDLLHQKMPNYKINDKLFADNPIANSELAKIRISFRDAERKFISKYQPLPLSTSGK
jgi:superfamily II DNA or RNA helicase